VFDKAIGSNNIKTITDFNHEEDTIRLSKKIFNKIATKSSPNFTEDKFMSADGATQATEASQRIILNTADGKLFYDADGLGGVDAVHFATINFAGVSSVDHTDFILA
jgi:Ca2+-binding RTX toxin-like protein